MKKGVSKPGPKLSAEVAAQGCGGPPWTLLALVCAGAVLIGLALYAPAMTGDFVFDDLALPFQRTSRVEPLASWLSGVRPVLMFSYWVNQRVWGEDSFSFHILNFIIHVGATGLVFLVLYRLFEIAGWASKTKAVAAVIGAAVFLIHPLETESVSYIAGRSESMSAFFVLLAYAVFLYRAPEGITWTRAAAVLALFALAVGTKENAVALAGLLLLTDVFWPAPFSTRGLRANWRLYALIAPAAAAGAVLVFRMLAAAPTAGFSLRAFTWWQYLFTEARAVFVYIRLAILPFGQSLDHDFPPSRTVLEHGAILYMAALAGLVAAAMVMRRRYPLSCFGLLFFLILLAPTSSVVPIADALVERRMYLPLIGLILIGCELASRVRWRWQAWPALAAGLVLLAGLCEARNRLWSRPADLWAAAANQATHSSRPLVQLTDHLIFKSNCAAALPYLEKASQVFPSDHWVELSWGRVLECLGRREEAMVRLQRAAAIAPTSKAFELIGLLYGEMNRSEEAGAALQTAIDLDPKSVTAHKGMALWYESVGNRASAEREYATVLSLDPHDADARAALNRMRSLAAQ